MDDRLQRVREQIDREVSRRHANRVLHGHPSPLFWLDQDIPVETVMEHRRTTRLVFPTRLSLYVATPYCLPTTPDRCGFCLFPSEIYRNQEQRSEEHTSELQSRLHLVCRLLLEKKKNRR